jgi:hypothetical protein
MRPCHNLASLADLVEVLARKGAAPRSGDTARR